ncbi:MAG: hypothetical protein AAB214_16585, partial [Fibrobacterota bacterium]
MKRSTIRSPVRAKGSIPTTTPPLEVNLIAFETRFIKICRSRFGSPTSRSGIESWSVLDRATPFASAWTFWTSQHRVNSSRMQNPVCSSRSIPASILEKSRMSLISES